MLGHEKEDRGDNQNVFVFRTVVVVIKISTLFEVFSIFDVWSWE